MPPSPTYTCVRSAQPNAARGAEIKYATNFTIPKLVDCLFPLNVYKPMLTHIRLSSDINEHTNANDATKLKWMLHASCLILLCLCFGCLL